MAGLTLNQLREVYNANRSRYETEFKETQPQKDYPIARMSMQHAQKEDATHTLEWTYRRKAATGSIQAVNPYERVEGVRDEYDATLSIQPKHYITHKERVFSALATIFSKSSRDQLWKDYKMKESSAEENWWGFWESVIWNVPYSVSAMDAYLGWLYWLPRSMTSGGVYVEQLKPARNGVYVRLGDGSLVSTVAGQDRASASNARIRGLVGTHRGSMGVTMLNTVEDAIIDSGFKFLPSLQGEKPAMTTMNVFWDEVKDRAYSRMLDDAGGPKRRDWFGGGPKTIAGADCVPCEALNGHFLSPIFCIRHSNIGLVQFNGNWGREIEDWDGQDKMGKFKGYSAQGRAKEIATCGALIHGEFSTGTYAPRDRRAGMDTNATGPTPAARSNEP